MQIKVKQVLLLGAFIVLTLIGYYLLPKDEIIIQTNSSVAENENYFSGNQEKKNNIFVHIEGAINFPGIKEVPEGTRLFELIELAGGETENADVSKVNLASVLKDEQKIYIPFLIMDIEIDNDLNLDSSFQNEMININYATEEELQTLSGIGPSMAKKIIAYRDENGYFNSIEDIMNVTGIGENKYNKIRNNITI